MKSIHIAHLLLHSGCNWASSDVHSSSSPYESQCISSSSCRSFLSCIKNHQQFFLNLTSPCTDKMGPQFFERLCVFAAYSLLIPPSVTSIIYMKVTETSQAKDYQWYGLQWGRHSRSRCMLEKERGICFHANMTHNKVFFERDKVETANMQSTVNVPVCKLQKKELSVIPAITVPLI